MASVKPFIKNDFVKNSGKANIKIRVSHKSETRFISTEWDIEPKFMRKDGSINPSYTLSTKLNRALRERLIEYEEIIIDLGAEVRYMDINTLVSRLKRDGNNADFIQYAQDRIKEYEAENKHNTARTYGNVISVLHKSYTKLPFSSITPTLLDTFNSHLKVNGVSQSTRSQYLSVLRSIFYHALKKKIVKVDNPFTGITFTREKNKKSSVSVEDIRTIANGKFSKAQQLSVDMFMLSLFLMGANLVDILYLKQDSLQCDFITYVRRKVKERTTIPVKVKVLPHSTHIIEKYKGNRYLLNILDKDDSHANYMQTEINLYRMLKKVQAQTGVKSDLSIGRARNTWATIAYLTGATDTEVDFALAHNLNTISRQYADFSKLYDMVNAVNEKVIAYILG